MRFSADYSSKFKPDSTSSIYLNSSGLKSSNFNNVNNAQNNTNDKNNTVNELNNKTSD